MLVNGQQDWGFFRSYLGRTGPVSRVSCWVEDKVDDALHHYLWNAKVAGDQAESALQYVDDTRMDKGELPPNEGSKHGAALVGPMGVLFQRYSSHRLRHVSFVARPPSTFW